MKFFTPDLLERFASEDDRLAEPAHEELERRSVEYHRHLARIAMQLPPRFIEMQDSFYLHDARVQSSVMPWSRSQFQNGWPEFLSIPWENGVASTTYTSFFLVLQLDPPPKEFLVLHYQFARIGDLAQHPLMEESLPYLEWQHDEVALGSSGEHPEFNHSILFTNGFEVTIRFRDFDYATLAPLGQVPIVKLNSPGSKGIRGFRGSAPA